MLILLFSLFSNAEDYNASIVVSDTRYEEIYFEEPRVLCEVPCSFEEDTAVVFVEANKKHRAWLKSGKVTGIYNDETIKYAYDDCNFKLDPHGCANTNGLWVMRTTITVTKAKASINVMLFDENAAMIGQGTYTRFKKTRVIERKKVTQQRVPGAPGTMSRCNQLTGICSALPLQGGSQTATQSEDLEPVVIDIPPTLLDRDIGQTMIYVYDSVR